MPEIQEDVEKLVEKARSSCAMSGERLRAMLSEKSDYDKVLAACARNVKMGPWKATSGLTLEYYLNAATNMLDKEVAASITRMTLDVIRGCFRPKDGSSLLVVGMEMAGGIMAGQCAALAPITHPDLLSWCDFVYCRKERKTSGTCQQLEGPNQITSRTPESPAQSAIWVDDALSSGGSMRDGARLLKADYNIDLVGAVYLVDRSVDRKRLAIEKLGTADPILSHTETLALFDLEGVDASVPRKKARLD
ncbi:unnamed protein product [Polarella glacialis]|uniref:Phosphoribosyltransferase domain-containing protein n=1 Tax=Polarella glacialis TaxID=89957 RepID=A0A813KX36_POLGL|nr:unnamed protein product [Polarella glacialis]